VGHPAKRKRVGSFHRKSPPFPQTARKGWRTLKHEEGHPYRKINVRPHKTRVGRRQELS
jgi:hypothetical protein